MQNRILVAISALLCLGSALMGVQFSGATWTHTSTYGADISAANDWTPPTVSVTSPGAVVTGSVDVKARASDSRSNVASVVVELAPASSMMWQPLAGCTTTGTNPMDVTCPWSTTGVTDGNYQLHAIATDTEGNTATSAPVNVAIANNTSVVLAPLPNAFGGTVQVRGDLVGSVVPATLTVEYKSATGGWTQLCNSASSPVQCSWNTTQPKIPDGTYDVRLSASTGQVATQAGIVVDNTAPSGTLAVPTGQLAGTVNLSATGSDTGSGVSSVKIQYTTTAGTWVDCGTGTSSAACALDTLRLSDGPHDFRAVVTDAAGNTTTQGPVTRTVVNSTPTVIITAPTGTSNLDGVVPVQGTFTSPNGVSSVVVTALPAGGGSPTRICSPTASPFSCSWDTKPLASGDYTLQVTVTPTYGAAVTKTVAVKVLHPFSNVAIGSPTGGTVTGAVTISGPVSSSGTISKVEVTATPTGGGTPLAACTAANPTNGGQFSCAWNTAPAGSVIVYGTFQLTATMTDTNGKTTSAAVTVTVDNILASVVFSPPPYVRGNAQTLTATVTSNAGVSEMHFEGTINGTTRTLCTVTPPPAAGGTGSCVWRLPNVTYADYSVQAVITTTTGARVVSSVPGRTEIDNRPGPVKGVNVAISNGKQSGLLDNGDVVELTYSGLVKLDSIQQGLTYDKAVPVSVSLSGGNGNQTDSLVLPSALGTVSFSQSVAEKKANVTYTGTTMTASQVPGADGPVTVIRLVLGVPSTGLQATSGSTNLTWTPGTTATDNFGGPCLATAIGPKPGSF